jgi:hydrogenase maturation protease
MRTQPPAHPVRRPLGPAVKHPSEREFRLVVAGIGNTLAGDDGVGVRIVERLRRRWEGASGVGFTEFPGDLLAVSDWLDRTSRFLFVDAVAGDSPGEIVRLKVVPRAFAPSLHQTDIGSVMVALEGLEMASPFPEWEVWGVVIQPPQRLTEALSEEVARGAAILESAISEEIAPVVGL